MTGVGGTHQARFVSSDCGLGSLRFAYVGPGGDTAKVFSVSVRMSAGRK